MPHTVGVSTHTRPHDVEGVLSSRAPRERSPFSPAALAGKPAAARGCFVAAVEVSRAPYADSTGSHSQRCATHRAASPPPRASARASAALELRDPAGELPHA